MYDESIMREITRNMDAMTPGVQAFLRRLACRMDAETKRGTTPAIKNEVLLSIVRGGLASAVGSNTACRNGCSHCCHQAVSISSWEANRIRAYTGRVPFEANYENQFAGASTATKMFDVVEGSRERYKGKPCTFLVEGKCSIYEVRPMECRLLYNVSDTPSLCEDMEGTMPGLDLGEVHLLVALVNFDAFDFADIRDFFPDTRVTL